ncbi:MAG: hypothetical protein IPN87_15695 [Saprospiraceae bacterium]|nr:hypothetical protein [Candidatus Brachybacter algidus]
MVTDFTIGTIYTSAGSYSRSTMSVMKVTGTGSVHHNYGIRKDEDTSETFIFILVGSSI